MWYKFIAFELFVNVDQDALTRSGYAPSTISSSIGRLQTFLEVAINATKRSTEKLLI